MIGGVPPWLWKPPFDSIWCHFYLAGSGCCGGPKWWNFGTIWTFYSPRVLEQVLFRDTLSPLKNNWANPPSLSRSHHPHLRKPFKSIDVIIDVSRCQLLAFRNCLYLIHFGCSHDASFRTPARCSHKCVSVGLQNGWRDTLKCGSKKKYGLRSRFYSMNSLIRSLCRMTIAFHSHM